MDHGTTEHSIQILSILDTHSQQSPTIQVKTRFTGADVAAVLDDLVRGGHCPTTITIDPPAALVDTAVAAWAAAQPPMTVRHPRPGSPSRHAAIESLQRRLRRECLSVHVGATVDDLQTAVEAWREGYNTRQ